MASDRRDSAIATMPRLLGWATVAVLATACGSLPPSAEPTPGEAPSPLAAEVETATEAAAEPGEFTIAARRIDTWNAVGQILVRLDGVIYKGRSQMLGIYAVRYRGEEFLIVTRGLVMKNPSDPISTRIRTILPDGQRHHSEPALELLVRLQQDLPGELARLTADEDYQKLFAPPNL